ncbi:MAG: choice-of-anchor Q domain-containing protein [Dokdonella sp.]
MAAPAAMAAHPVSAESAYTLALAQRQALARGEVDRKSRAVSRPSGVILPVTSCADDGSAGTLRSVLLQAASGDTVDLSALTCSTISLASGALDMGVYGDNHIYEIHLVGPGRDKLTIDGGGTTDILVHNHFMGSKGILSVSDLSLANGTYVGGLPGCINASGKVTLTRVDISNCRSSGGGPLFATAVSAGELVMQSSTVTGSSGSTTGTGETRVVLGTVYAQDVALIDSTISGNAITSVSGGNDSNYFSGGGGVYAHGDLVMSNSTISGNSATTTGSGFQAVGGGIFVTGKAMISNSTVADNSASGFGGGVMKNVASPYGDFHGSTLTISNSTISGNTATLGAGIASSRPVLLGNSTVAFNEASDGAAGVFFRLNGFDNLTFDFQNTILANSAAAAATYAADLGASGNLQITGGNNLIVDPGSLAVPADTLSADPLLLPLADNGGVTQTHALANASPAIDAGSNPEQLAFDQRGEGFPRQLGAATDIGALEWSGQTDDTIFRNGFELPVEVTYAYDDGDGNTNQGPPSSFNPDMLWGNYYLTEPDGEIITRISVAFGPTFPSLGNGPVTFWLLDDPDMDMDPRNAISLVSVQGTPDVFNDNFYTVDIPPTRVSGAFFVGASAKLVGGQDRPARVDTGTSGNDSWFFYAPEISDVIDDLTTAPFSSRNIAPTVPIPGAFMVRASGIPAN